MKSNFKFLIVLTILLVGCICVGSTFAADSTMDVTDVMGVDNTQNIEIAYDDSSTKSDEITNLEAGEGTFSELENNIRDKINYTLDKDYKFSSTDFKFGINIYKDDFVLDGAGHTIDGSGIAQVFLVSANNVTIKNIKFINTNTSDNGGAISWNSRNGVVSNCTFINTSSSNYGGAIYFIRSSNGNVSNCTFINTSALSGGAIFWQGINGNVSGCTFINTTSPVMVGLST